MRLVQRRIDSLSHTVRLLLLFLLVGGVDPSETACVFIEFQNEFTTPGGKLHDAVKDCMAATGTVPNAQRVMQQARAAGCTIVHCPISFEKVKELIVCLFFLRCVYRDWHCPTGCTQTRLHTPKFVSSYGLHLTQHLHFALHMHSLSIVILLLLCIGSQGDIVQPVRDFGGCQGGTSLYGSRMGFGHLSGNGSARGGPSRQGQDGFVRIPFHQSRLFVAAKPHPERRPGRVPYQLLRRIVHEDGLRTRIPSLHPPRLLRCHLHRRTRSGLSTHIRYVFRPHQQQRVFGVPAKG